ncbi:major facilitator superfamily domain-containing protein [Lasiosphaeria ovina]|uniref:Major facilitator superfamily domain-containing protein n=1 Tax=Lasiosphaeria ovina TaxID=92902 RepID=A0AAE0K3G0_9PEZI|nr:major facilitator superfamily domain-containing protein [Lasiosphaeria ovina]
MAPPSDSPSLSSATIADPGPGPEAKHQGAASRLFNTLGTFAQTRPDLEKNLGYSYAGSGTDADPFLVEFLPNDPHDALNFSKSKKWTITAIEGMATLAVTFASSAYSGAAREVVRQFAVSQIVVTLGVSLFVLGFAIGPLFWAPLGELYGRQRIFIITFAAITAFNAGAAGAPTMAALLVLRFFAGAFGSSILTNAGGVIADMFNASERGLATSVFAMAPFLGPAIGPIAGGFLSETEGWRWVEGLMAIFTGVLWIIGVIFIPETYAPVLLRRRAKLLSKTTGKTYISTLDAGKPPTTLFQKCKTALTLPWVLLAKEPIVLITSIYIAIIYGTLYLNFAAYPIVFQQQRGWSPGIGGLAFIGTAVGVLIATIGSIIDNKRYVRLAAAAKGGVLPPESRLPPAILGSVLIPAGLFWFAWTCGPDIHWSVSIIASAFFACGLILVFLSLINYLIDSYVVFAASILAAGSVVRSLFGFAFPLFTGKMYENLGIHWAGSVPAFLALACVPFPFLFWRYGAPIRMRCEFASEAARILEQMRASRNAPAPVVTEEDAVAEAIQVWRTRSHASGAAPAH